MAFLRELLARELLQIGDSPLTLGTLVLVVLIVAFTFVLSRWLQAVSKRAFQLRGVDDVGTIGVTGRLVHYVVLLVGFSIALETAGIRLSGLFAAGAVFAVGVGFAMQTIVQNFVSGVILLIERSIRPGDVLEVDGEIVKVRHMYIRSTVVTTLDDLDAIVPNSALVQSSVRNLSYLDRRFRVRACVGVHYESDMDQVRTVLEHAGSEVLGRLKDAPPLVLLLEFNTSSVDWEVSIWTDDPWRQRRLRSVLNEQIWTSLKEAGITISYPQLDVHVKQLSAASAPPPAASE